MLSHRETKVGSDSDLKSRGPVQTQQNFPTSLKSVCGALSVGRGLLPEFICHLDSQKNGRKMRAANRRKRPVTAVSPVDRGGQAKTAEEKRRFARLDVSAPALTLPFFPGLHAKEAGFLS